MEKKIKVSGQPATKALSITLPIPLVDKLTQLSASSRGINISRAIRFVLEEYFAINGDGELFPEINKSDCLVPVDLYAKIMNVGKITIKNRAAKGEVNIVTMFNTDFVKCDKDDIINYFAQVQIYKKEVEELKIKLYEKYNELEKKVNLLANAISRQ